ncbi:unnamed protein product [Caretta caretta]
MQLELPEIPNNVIVIRRHCSMQLSLVLSSSLSSIASVPRAQSRQSKARLGSGFTWACLGLFRPQPASVGDQKDQGGSKGNLPHIVLQPLCWPESFGKASHRNLLPFCLILCPDSPAIFRSEKERGRRNHPPQLTSRLLMPAVSVSLAVS